MARPTVEPLAPFFRSMLQAALLARMLHDVDRWVPMTDLAALGKSHQAVRLELGRLVDAGVVEQDASVRPHIFRIPSDGPITVPLRELVQKTVGVEPLLVRALTGVAGLRAAALHGSWAARRVTPTSDVDVLVLVDGDFRMEHLRQVESSVEHLTGRQLDTIVFPVAEARAKLEDGSGFLRTVLAGPLVPLVGDVHDELGREPAA